MHYEEAEQLENSSLFTSSPCHTTHTALHCSSCWNSTHTAPIVAQPPLNTSSTTVAVHNNKLTLWQSWSTCDHCSQFSTNPQQLAGEMAAGTDTLPISYSTEQITVGGLQSVAVTSHRFKHTRYTAHTLSPLVCNETVFRCTEVIISTTLQPHEYGEDVPAIWQLILLSRPQSPYISVYVSAFAHVITRFKF